MKKIILLISIIIGLYSPLFSQSVSSSDIQYITGEKYVTGSDGVVRVHVNIWGHVKTPGTFLIFDGADLINALSISGGPLQGANLKQVEVISNDNKSSIFINLEDPSQYDNSYKIKPFDTIVVKQSARHKFFTQSSVIQVLIQLISLIYTIDRLDNE